MAGEEKDFLIKNAQPFKNVSKKIKPLEGRKLLILFEDDNIVAAALSESQIIRLESDVDAILDDDAREKDKHVFAPNNSCFNNDNNKI